MEEANLTERRRPAAETPAFHNATMRIAFIGVGGVGGYFGGRLAQAGQDITFIARGATLDALRTHGLRVDSPLGDFTVHPLNVTPTGPQYAVGGLCAIVSYSVAPGHIRHAAFEPTVMFGELDHRRSERVEHLRAAFAQAGVRAEIPPDIRRSMWTKFLFIATMSGIGALTRVPVGVWRADPEIRALADRSLREVLQLATDKGIDLGADAVERTWERYDAMTPDSTSSMQRDIMDGKPSELDAQLGAIVRLAGESGVDVPVSAMIYHALAPQERRARGL